MSMQKNPLSLAHLITFVGLLGFFMILTYLITDQGIDKGPSHHADVVKTTMGTICGPMTGAIARGFQSCCWDFSLKVMMFVGPLLLVCLVLQMMPMPEVEGVNVVRLILWCIGWVGWFSGGIISFFHALC